MDRIMIDLSSVILGLAHRVAEVDKTAVLMMGVTGKGVYVDLIGGGVMS